METDLTATSDMTPIEGGELLQKEGEEGRGRSRSNEMS